MTRLKHALGVMCFLFLAGLALSACSKDKDTGGLAGETCFARNDCAKSLACINEVCSIADYPISAQAKGCDIVECAADSDCAMALPAAEQLCVDGWGKCLGCIDRHQALQFSGKYQEVYDACLNANGNESECAPYHAYMACIEYQDWEACEQIDSFEGCSDSCDIDPWNPSADNYVPCSQTTARNTIAQLRTYACDNERCVDVSEPNGGDQCAEDEHCSYERVCDEGFCVDCRSEVDCANGQICTDAGACIDQCNKNSCALFNTCNETTGKCEYEGCSADRECILWLNDAEAVCTKQNGESSKQCIISCDRDTDCGDGEPNGFEVCDKGVCTHVGCASDEECRIQLGDQLRYSQWSDRAQALCRDE